MTSKVHVSSRGNVIHVFASRTTGAQKAAIKNPSMELSVVETENRGITAMVKSRTAVWKPYLTALHVVRLEKKAKPAVLRLSPDVGHEMKLNLDFLQFCVLHVHIHCTSVAAGDTDQILRRLLRLLSRISK